MTSGAPRGSRRVWCRGSATRASRRARGLRRYSTEALVAEENDKPTVIALREIAEGLISHEILDSQEVSLEEDDEEIEMSFNIAAINSGEPGADEPAAG